jgi:hypothetical protein
LSEFFIEPFVFELLESQSQSSFSRLNTEAFRVHDQLSEGQSSKDIYREWKIRRDIAARFGDNFSHPEETGKGK